MYYELSFQSISLKLHDTQWMLLIQFVLPFHITSPLNFLNLAQKDGCTIQISLLFWIENVLASYFIATCNVHSMFILIRSLLKVINVFKTNEFAKHRWFALLCDPKWYIRNFVKCTAVHCILLTLARKSARPPQIKSLPKSAQLSQTALIPVQLHALKKRLTITFQILLCRLFTHSSVSFTHLERKADTARQFVLRTS